MQSYGRQNKSNYFNRTRNSDKKDRWDHDGYDKLATDQYYSSKYEKNWSKSKPDSAYYTTEKYVVKKQTQPEKADKWQHDKFEAAETDPKQGDIHRGKKPDQQLYKPPKTRGERGQIQRQSVLSNNSISQKSEENAETPKVNRNPFDLQSFEDREYKLDEELCSVSSESTAHSEKLRNDEDGSKLTLKEAMQKDSLISSVDVSTVDKLSSSCPIFEFSVVLPDGISAELRFYESNEEEIDSLIDSFCEACDIHGELRLQIKIRIVGCLLSQNTYDKKKLDDLYTSLLNANFELIKESMKETEESLDAGMISNQDFSIAQIITITSDQLYEQDGRRGLEVFFFVCRNGVGG